MRIRTFALALLVCLLAWAPAYADNHDKLVGIWKRVSAKNVDTGQENTAPVWLIVTKTHFSVVGSTADRKKIDKPLDEMTKEQLRDRIRFLGNYGTYKVEGNKMIRHRIAAINPLNEGTDLTQEFRFEGDYVTFKFKSRAGNNLETKLKRVE